MHLPRRHLLKLSASLPLSLPAVFGVNNVLGLEAGSTAANIAFIKIPDQVAAPAFNEGDHVLIDKQINSFQGQGLYLYPNWGQPRIYRVKEEQKGVLSFYNPAQQTLLWRMTISSDQEALFAGQTIAVLAQASHQQIQQSEREHEKLRLPALPLDHAIS